MKRIQTALMLVLWLIPRPTEAGSILLAPIAEATREVRSIPMPAVETLLPPGAPYPGVLFASHDGRVAIDRDSSLEFALSLPAGATILSATLTLDVAGAQQTGGTPASLVVGGYGDDDGAITLADFHRPVSAIGSTGPLPNAIGPYDLDLPRSLDATELVRSLYNEGVPFAGFRMAVQVQGNVTVWDAASSHPAHLMVSYHTPEPPSLVILLAAVPLWLWVSWRR